MTAFDLGRSEALHQRVREYVDTVMRDQTPSETFDQLAVAIAAHQVCSSTGLERLVAARGRSIDDLLLAADIPAVPTDVFKLRRVACHPPELDIVTFLTSGTSFGTQGKHAMRTIATYRHAARAWGKHMLSPDADRLNWILLTQPFDETRTSSLGFMLDDFAKAFGADVTWGLHKEAIDVSRIDAGIAKGRDLGVPLIVAGASFAFVHLLDRLDGRQLSLGPGGRVMQTGGFKGRSRQVDATTLRSQIADTFGIDEARVVGEYGMTELSSQAYEGCLRKKLGFGSSSSSPGVFVPPCWMRIRAVDPVSLLPVSDGEVGIARIEDLTNVDSAVVVQTADRVQECEEGIRLLGRMPGAMPRGCSIGVDELLGAPER